LADISTARLLVLLSLIRSVAQFTFEEQIHVGLHEWINHSMEASGNDVLTGRRL